MKGGIRLKLLKYFTLFISLFLFFLLVGCNMFEDELKNDEENEQKIEDELNQNDNEGKDNAELNYDGPVDFKVYPKLQKGDTKDKILRVDTYQDYLNINSQFDSINYDEEFFLTSSLIIYYQFTDSQARQVNVKSIVVENSNLIVDMSKDYSSGCVLMYYGYFIEYKKPAKPVNEINVKIEVTNYNAKRFVDFKNQLDEAKDFVEKVAFNECEINIYVKNDINTTDLTKEQIADYQELILKQNIEKYGLDRFDGYPFVDDEDLTFCYPLSLTMDELDLDLLHEIANIDERIYMNIVFAYDVISFVEYKV